MCDLRVTNGCYIYLYENVKVGFLYNFSGGRRMKSAGLFKKAIALTMSTSMLLGSGGYTKAFAGTEVRTIQPLSSMQIHMKVVQML